MCCDAEAIGEARLPREAYAQMLLDVLRRRRILRAMSPALGVSPVQVTARRLDHVLSARAWPHRRLPARYWVTAAIALLLILPGARGVRADSAGSTPATQPAQAAGQLVHFVRVVVDVNSITFEGKPTTLADLPARLEAVGDRQDTVLQLAYASNQVTMGWFESIQGAICNDDERKKLGFKYVSFVGLAPADSVGSPDKIVPTVQAPHVMPALPQAPDAKLTQNVAFQLGQQEFQNGDSITITQVRGTADAIKPGETYEVIGRYHLVSHDRATLALSVSAKRPEDAYGYWASNQTVSVARGDGEFTLHECIGCEGYPHVSFYADGGSIGGVYFGTGDSLLSR
jgi:hypothetical protein